MLNKSLLSSLIRALNRGQSNVRRKVVKLVKVYRRGLGWWWDAPKEMRRGVRYVLASAAPTRSD